MLKRKRLIHPTGPTTTSHNSTPQESAKKAFLWKNAWFRGNRVIVLLLFVCGLIVVWIMARETTDQQINSIKKPSQPTQKPVVKKTLSTNWDFNYRQRYINNETNENYDLILIYYSRLFGARAESSYLSGDVGTHICNITDIKTNEIYLNRKVLLTSNNDKYGEYGSGFIFHGPDVSGSPLNLRGKKTMNDREDIYIYHNMESPGATSVSLRSESIMKDYNLLMSYQFNSEIFLPYIGRGTLRLLVDREIRIPFSSKNNEAPLAWIGSNCGAQNGRQDYLKELFKYVNTHSYGACLRNVNENVARGDAMMAKIAQYKFYIVMENSNCRDYITEKLGTAIASTTVPVVFSVNNTIPNYEYYMPEHSYINAGDFNSAKELGQYLTYVANNETLYNSYLQYKFNSLTENGKEQEWNKILQRFQHKETAKHWCRAANQVFNHMKYNLKNQVQPDNSCYQSGIMSQYIDRHKDNER